MSLRIRIMLVALMAIVVVSVANVRLVSEGYRDRYQQLVTERAGVAAHDLALQVNRLLELGLYLHEFSGFDRQLDKMLDDNPGIRQAVIIDRNERVLYRSRAPAWPPFVEDFAGLVRGGDDAAGTPFSRYPLGPDRQDPLGYIVVLLNAQQIDDEIDAFNRSMLLYIVFAALLGLGLLYLLLRYYLGRPTDDLLKAIREARLDQDYHPSPCLIERRDEIGLVARTFDDLIVRLSETSHALAEQRNRALAADRAKSQFLANVSHELLTPLNGINGMAHLLGKSELDDRQRERLGKIQQSADRLHAIVTNILDFSSVDSGAMRLEIVDLDLHRLVGDSLKSQIELARAKQVELSIGIDEQVPQDLRGDPARLAQVLQNLVNNGIKFNPPGSRVSLNVTIERLEQDAALLRFAVVDDGVGMSEEMIKRLFQPFDQADNSDTRTHGGAGLGLGISQHIVALMGGLLQVDSEPQRGSRFWFSLRFARGLKEP